MINEYMVKETIKHHADTLPFYVENDNIVSKEDGEVVCSLDTYMEAMKRRLHCDFELVYAGSCVFPTVLRCKECGTVVFSHGYEYEDYDPDLCCPDCGNYKTNFAFYTKAEIESDPNKQAEIKFLEEQQIEDEKSYARSKKRNKTDQEIFKFRIKLSQKHALKVDLKCDNLFRTFLKGLYLSVHWLEADEDNSMLWTFKKHIVVPLSWKAYQIHYAIPRKVRKEHDALGR